MESLGSRVTTLLQSLRSCVYDPAYYSTHVRNQSVETGAKLTLALGLLGIGIFMVIAYTAIIPFAYSHGLDKLEAVYPDELVITAGNGQVTTNQPQPYYVKNTLFSEGPTNLVVFDTEDTLPLDLQAASTLVLVKKTFMISSEKADVRTATFGPIKATTTISKADVLRVIDPLKPFFTPTVLIGGFIALLVALFFGTIFWALFHLLYLLLPALLVFFFTRFRIDTLRFKEAYMTVLYASFPVAIFSYLSTVAQLHWPTFVYTLLVLLIAAINMTDQKRSVPLDGPDVSAE